MNVSSSASELVCALSEDLYFGSPYIKWIFICETVLDALAILSISIVTICAFFDNNYHFNLRVLLICLCSALMVANIGALLNSLYYLSAIALRRPKELCDWLTFTKADCLALKQVLNLGITAAVLSTLIFSIERTVASLLADSYVLHRRRWLGFTLAAVQWLLTVPAVLYADEHEAAASLPYCARELFEPNVARNVQLALIVAQICGTVMLIVLWHHNSSTFSRRRCKGSEQSVPRELGQALSVAEVLPVVFLNGALVASAAALSALFLPGRASPADPPGVPIELVKHYAVYAEAQACVLPIVSILLLVCTQRSKRRLWTSLRHAAGLHYADSLACSASSDSREQRHVSAHLEPLEKRWNALFPSDFVIDSIFTQTTTPPPASLKQ